jgi:hypothetical protein
MDKIVPVKHDIPTTLWCGPAVLSAVTGEPVSKITQILMELRHAKNPADIKGISNWQLEETARKLGYELKVVHNYFPQVWTELRTVPTLAKYARECRAYFQKNAVIVNVTGHYIALFGRRFVDNHTKKPVFLTKSPHRRARVQRAWQVTKLGESIQVAELAPSYMPPKKRGKYPFQRKRKPSDFSTTTTAIDQQIADAMKGL